MELCEAIDEIRNPSLNASNRMMAYEVCLNAIIDGTLIPADSVFQVKDGYRITAQFHKTIYEDCGLWDDAPLSEALTIRSADDVRREAIRECLTKLSEGYQQGVELVDMVNRISALIDTPQPKGGDDE